MWKTAFKKMLRQTMSLQIFKFVFRKFYVVHSWILYPISFFEYWDRSGQLALISDGRNITKRLFAFTEMQGHYHDCDQYWKLFWRSCTIFHSFWNSLQTAFLLSGLEFLILYGYFSYWLYKLNTYAAVITYSW